MGRLQYVAAAVLCFALVGSVSAHSVLRRKSMGQAPMMPPPMSGPPMSQGTTPGGPPPTGPQLAPPGSTPAPDEIYSGKQVMHALNELADGVFQADRNSYAFGFDPTVKKTGEVDWHGSETEYVEDANKPKRSAYEKDLKTQLKKKKANDANVVFIWTKKSPSEAMSEIAGQYPESMIYWGFHEPDEQDKEGKNGKFVMESQKRVVQSGIRLYFLGHKDGPQQLVEDGATTPTAIKYRDTKFKGYGPPYNPVGSAADPNVGEQGEDDEG